MRKKRVCTVGYEGHDPESFVETLRKARIERVIDVRELPLSRKSGFSKSALAAGLKAAGIAYSHVKALGTPRAVRHAWKAGGSFDDFRRDYLAHLAENADAVEELERVASAERCALLCVERDVETCHRGLLAEVLETRGWTTTHL